MDLLLISRCPPYPLHQGDRLIPYYLAREFSARRDVIDLLAFYQEPEDLAEVPRYDQFFRHVALYREPPRTLRSYWQRSRKPALRFPRRAEDSWSPEMWRAIAERIRDRAYDVVHVFGGIQVYEYLHLVRQLPNVIVPYESYSLWLERAVQEERGRIARWKKQLQLRMARSYESWMFDQYERVVVLTERDARALKSLNPHIPVVVIPNGVDVDRFNPPDYEPNEPTLLFIGNYDYPPNLDAALRLARDIFPLIQKAVPKTRLYLVGGNPPPELRACASQSIQVTGYVPDVRPYFDLSLIFVSPLRLGAGIKNKVLEALAMRKPVVATPLSCEGIPVQHGQHVLLGTSDEELVKAVLHLFKTPRLRHQLAVNGRQLIEQFFTWQCVADQYDNLYAQVIQEHRDRVLGSLT